MWVAKIDVFIPEDILWRAAYKSKVIIRTYPIKQYIKNNRIYYVVSCFLEGGQKDKKMAIAELRNNKWTVHFETKGDYFLLFTYRPLTKEEELHQSIFFDPALIYTKPIIIHPTGTMTMTIGSWNKKYLSTLITNCKKYYRFKLVSIKKEKATMISISVPYSLTDKQQRALALAIKHGYYEYPRKTELKELAKLMGISFSTYKAHLHKAERQLIPFLMANVK